MNFAVPMNLAMLSDHLPNASGSKRGSWMRPGSFGWSRRRESATGTSVEVDRLTVVAVAPVLGQQVVQDVVDGDRADEPVVVHDRHADEVVGRHAPGDVGQGGLRFQRVDVVVHHATE